MTDSNGKWDTITESQKTSKIKLLLLKQPGSFPIGHPEVFELIRYLGYVVGKVPWAFSVSGIQTKNCSRSCMDVGIVVCGPVGDLLHPPGHFMPLYFF